MRGARLQGVVTTSCLGGAELAAAASSAPSEDSELELLDSGGSHYILSTLLLGGAHGGPPAVTGPLFKAHASQSAVDIEASDLQPESYPKP